MTRKKTCLLSALCTILLLLSCSCARPILCEVCGKPAFNHVCCPAAPCPVCGATYLCDCAVETVAEGSSSGLAAGDSSVWLERPLLSLNMVRTLALSPIGERDIDPADGEKMYAKAGIGTIRFAELPTQFEIKWDERIEAQSITVTRYPLYDHTAGEACEPDENKLVFEAGYYYEIRLITPTGSLAYGITTAAAPVKLTSPTNPRDVQIGYTYLGEEKQKKISSSLSSAYWNGMDPSSGEVVSTAASAPYQLPGLCEINATEAQVTLFENMEIAAFVISTIPVDEHNELIIGSGGQSAKFTVVNNTFELLEGSHYYGVYVCFDGRSFDRYGFIAHYDPNKTAEDDPVAALPILTDAPPLQLSRPIYGANAQEIVHVLYPYGAINADIASAPFDFDGKYIGWREAGVAFRIVPDSALDVKSIVCRAYPRDKIAEWKYIDVSNGMLSLEENTCYEFEVICEEGRAIYGICCMKKYDTNAAPIPEQDIFVHYGYLGRTLRQMIHNSDVHVSWSGDTVTQTAVVRPHTYLSALPVITPTSADAHLDTRDGGYVMVYAAAAYPLDESGALQENGEWTQLSMQRFPYGADYPQSFTLLEGSYYYELYVCYDATSYDLYAFVAHYTPTETGGNQ